MKKLTSKLKRNKPAKKPERITNATVAEHRERILAGARKFAYPIQYTRQQLVLIATGIGLAVVLLFVAFSWYQLYRAQTTGQFFYRITQLVPLPVAKVDDELVRYSDYLLEYRSNETYLTTVENIDKNSKEDGVQEQFDYIRVQAMQNAVANTYAQKIANERGIEITDDQVTAAIDRTRRVNSSQEISEAAYNRTLEQYYGQSPEEGRYVMKQSLLRQEVSYAIDERAQRVADAVEKRISAANGDSAVDFEKLAADMQGEYAEVQQATSGWVRENNPDGGIAAAAAALDKGQVAGPIKPVNGDGYYFVQLIDRNQNGEINYAQIKVPLLVFAEQVAALQQDGKIEHYITMPDIQPQLQSDDEN